MKNIDTIPEYIAPECIKKLKKDEVDIWRANWTPAKYVVLVSAEIKKHISCEAQARSFRLNSSRIDEKHPFVQKAMKLGRVPFGSPTLSDQALMSFPSVKIGPGRSSRSHTAEEYIMLKELEEAIGLYLELLDGLLI